MNPRLIFLAGTVLLLALLTGCGTNSQTETATPTHEVLPTSTKTATSTPILLTDTPTPLPPAEPRILYSIAPGAITFGMDILVPRGVGMVGVNSNTQTVLSPLTGEQTDFVGNPFSWSPDGAWVVFVSTRTGSAQLYVMSADGANIQPLLVDGDNASPAWSPDGGWIAFVSTRGSESNIYLIKPDGTNLSCLTCDIEGGEVSPAWSPDSGSVVFAPALGPAPLTVINVTTKETRLVSSPELKAAAPFFSPDGQFIIFECENTICTNTAYGNVQWMFPASGGIDSQAAMSPDGKQLAFISNRDGNYDLYLANVDGSEAVRLTSTLYAEMHPTWSPDGQWIAFASATAYQENYTNFEIFIIRPNGENMKQLTQSPENEFFPRWSPRP